MRRSAAANDTPFGLSAALFTANLRSALRFAEEARAGIVKINQESAGLEYQAPFGGMKDSSSGSREQGKVSREFFTRVEDCLPRPLRSGVARKSHGGSLPPRRHESAVSRGSASRYRLAAMPGHAVAHSTAELALDARAELGEGPHWHAERGELVWVDIMAGAVHQFEPASGSDRSFRVGQPVGAAVPRAAGGLVLALRDGIATVEDGPGELRWLASLERDMSRTRMNDAACDAAGRLWAGTMDMSQSEPIGSLYRIDPDGSVETALTGVTISNGLGWSPDGGTLYYVDTPLKRVDAFDFEPLRGAISRRRTLIEIEEGAGSPDGLTVDEEGCIWLALWEGWSVRRYHPDGRLLGVVEVPAARVTSCAFGGARFETLYITSARPEAADVRQPSAGGIFVARPGPRGLPAPVFAG